MWWKIIIAVVVGGGFIAAAIFAPPLGIAGIAMAGNVLLGVAGGAIAVGGAVHFSHQDAKPPNPNPVDPVAQAAAAANQATDQELANMQVERDRLIQELATERARNDRLEQRLDLLVNQENQHHAIITAQLGQVARGVNQVDDNVRGFAVNPHRLQPVPRRGPQQNLPANDNQPRPAGLNPN